MAYAVGRVDLIKALTLMPTFSIAEAILKHWGATVEPVPTSQKEESDWLATLDGFRLLIEEKTKLENPESVAARMASGQVYGSTTPLNPNNRVSGIIGKAAKQLRSTGADVQHDARVIWFAARISSGVARVRFWPETDYLNPF